MAGADRGGDAVEDDTVAEAMRASWTVNNCFCRCDLPSLLALPDALASHGMRENAAGERQGELNG
ncbi:MAG: hypothetical protein N2039_16095, partial [Gemmataceae bacterium]|nr:hypothetical protein [Gemmataceae bacterium]